MKRPIEMNPVSKYQGVVVPMVTPVTASGDLDEPALGRLISSLLAGGMEGIFVLGTTGEGASVPRSFQRRLVAQTVALVRHHALVYAGIGGTCLADAVAAANEYFQAGADVVVAHPPVYFPLQPQELLAWFQSLLNQVQGPVILYNMPATTRVSIPIEVIEQLAGHPMLAGLKDSENDAQRLGELWTRFGGRPDFSMFVGVGALMLQGLRLGARGVVPSVGNLIPEVCQGLCASAARGDWAEAERHAERMHAVVALYQKGRTLGQSLAALKAALHCRGLCGPQVLPPLLPLTLPEIETVRSEMSRLQLLDE
jgi:4-hydroxy-tetrahydrodipicolinate synthase